MSTDPPTANRVRSGPGKSNAIVGEIPAGQGMKILDGPSCANGWVWWKVETLNTGLTGWTAEGDKNAYWLVPCQPDTGCGILGEP